MSAAAAAKRQAARGGSALSVSSTEIDRQLDDLMVMESEDYQEETSKQEQRKEEEENESLDGGENVAVMVRCRPLSSSEQQLVAQSNNKTPIVQVDEANRCVQVDKERRFVFDQVFEPGASNQQVYMRSARRLVEFAFRGYNCTIFLYGQTGTGKTYTHSSLTLSAFEHLFSLIQDSDKQTRFLIRASYYELYNEQIRDLLAGGQIQSKSSSKSVSGRRTSELDAPEAPSDYYSKTKPLELHESKARGVYIKDLTCFLVNNPTELVKLKQLGDKRRTTAATKMNEHSSRSHSIFSITIETTTVMSGDETSVNNNTRSSATKGGNSSTSSLRLGRLHLIDLAGSERQSKSGSSGLQLREASRINLSLTCLSLVIRALTDKTSSGHIPYRNSKLTRLLSSSLGGNSKTLLMACISPAPSNLDETLNTLRFAARTKRIKNKAVINEDPKDALLRKYRRQLNELREKLSQTNKLELGQQQEHNQVTAVGQVEGVRVGGGEGGQSQDHYQLMESDVDDKSKQQQIQLMKQLELLKAKIMFGGENLLDKVELHERLLEASRQELEERQKAETKLRNELQTRERSFKNVVHSKGSLESQRSYLEEKLAKAISLYRRSKLELRDLSSEHDQLKEQLLLTIRSTSKEIKYIDCILDDFIPREYLDLINAYAQYDDESEEWQIKYIASSGNNIAQTRRLAMGVAGDVTTNEAAMEEQRGTAARMTKKRHRTQPASNRPDPYIRF